MAFDINQLRRKLVNSRFFTISVLLHTILVTILGGTVLFQKYVEPPDFTGEGGSGFVSADASSLPPQPTQPLETQPTFTVTTPTSAAPTLEAITTRATTQTSFEIPAIVTPTIAPTATSLTQATAPPAPAFGGMSTEVAKGVAGFSSGWSSGGSGGPGSSLKSREFQFTAFLAKYRGGDWASTVRLRNNQIVAGSLPNLLYIMGKWSRDKIKAHPQAVPLDLASQEIFAQKPPFIFFTGHRDFTLTDAEVENLRKYIRLGGCIWGDSSLPGQRSRFDIAFRREMRKVVPDIDKDFEPLPPDHAIFTRTYYPEIRTVPPGMNFYKEPVYALKIYGEIAVLYTANDYGDMWQCGLNEQGQFDLRRDEHNNYVGMNETIWNLRDVYFRNLTPEAVATTYKFGTNIVMHLITRWEDKVRNVPKGL